MASNLTNMNYFFFVDISYLYKVVALVGKSFNWPQENSFGLNCPKWLMMGKRRDHNYGNSV